MDKESGDDYIRRFATFLRSQERLLAEYGRPKSVHHQSYLPNMLGWIGFELQSPAPNIQRRHQAAVLSLDLHHLFYLLMRFEGIGVDVGSLDVKLQDTSRPTSYISMLAAIDKSDAMSISSLASSFSAISKLSLGVPWWGRSEPQNLDLDLKYIYSSFTKLPALSIRQNDLKVISEMIDDPPSDNAVPFDSFKSIQSLELLDIDPRALLGWDRLAESLRSLTIKRSGIEDFSDVLIDAVLDDEVRREGKGPPTVGSRRQGHVRFASNRSNKRGPLSGVPTPVAEDVEPGPDDDIPEMSASPPPSIPLLSRHKWRFLRHLSLSDNAITFLPTSPTQYLTSLTHLDLSSNLLISVPSGLSSLYNLVSLNLADNMIDSVLGIYTLLGQVLSLNLSRNRLESLCGLERLVALERVDLRHNNVEDTGEVGRLAVLPNISEVRIEGNPFTRTDESGYRIKCFEYFAVENKNVQLDGSGPSFVESRSMKTRPPPPNSTYEDPSISRRNSAAPSPPVVAVGTSPSSAYSHQRRQSFDPSSSPYRDSIGVRTPPPSSPDVNGLASPSSVMSTAAASIAGTKVLSARRRKPKRVVDLDGSDRDPSGSDNASIKSKTRLKPKSRHGLGASESVVPLDARRSPSESVMSASPTPGSKAVTNARLSPVGDAIAGSRTPDLRVREPTIDLWPSEGGGRKSSITIGGSRRRGHTRYSTEGNPAITSEERSRRLSATISDEGDSGNLSDSAVQRQSISDVDAYRARIEALREEVGDSWLTVLSQGGGFGAGPSSRRQSGTRNMNVLARGTRLHGGAS